jgi:hypothetical protein
MTKSMKGGHTYVTIRGIKATMTSWCFNELKLALPSRTRPSHALGTYRITMRLS